MKDCFSLLLLHSFKAQSVVDVDSPTTPPTVPLPSPLLVTVKVTLEGPPPEELTVTLTLEELFCEFESELVELTVAALATVCPPLPALMVAVIVVVAEAPPAKVPMFHKLVEALKLPTVEVEETKVKSEDKVSEATTPVAVLAALFLTTRV